MKYQVKYNGHLLKFADKLITMTKHFAQEGLNYLRVLAGGGTVPDRTFTEEYYKMAEENGMNDNIRLAVFPQSGYNKRESGIYKFVTRLFNLGNTTKYNATQLVTNGNFANGTTGWVGDYSTREVINGIMISTGNGTGLEPVLYAGIGTKIIGNKYYLRANVKTKSSLCTRIALRSLDTAQLVGNPTVNNPYILSGIITASTTYNLIAIYHRYATAADSNGAAIEVDNVMAINLTAAFGAGNEPTKEQCDLLFANYFDGTQEAVLNDVIQGAAASQPYLIRKGIKNPNGGSRFMTHPTISFAANETWSASWIGIINRVTYNQLFGSSGVSNNSMFTTSWNIGFSPYWRNSIGTSVATLDGSSFIRSTFGKTVHLVLTADGANNLKLYGNGQILHNSNFAAGTAMNFNQLGFANGISDTEAHNGIHNGYILREGVLTEAQVLAEYNFLKQYFPDVETKLIGSKSIAVVNFDSVATPKGNVINLINKETATETVLNGSFNTTDNWIIDTANGVYIDTVNGKLVVPTAVPNSYAAVASQNVLATYTGKLVLIKLVISEYVQGGLKITPGNSYVVNFNNLGNGTFYGFLNVPYGTKALHIIRSYDVGFVGKIDELSIREVGWSISDEIYSGIFNTTTGTVAQKTLAALKAAAMWRSPNSSLDDQAVFGKIYNGYAAQLLKLDIDTYNVENPTTPWGYHVATLTDFQSIKDTLGGVNTAGKKLKINGVEYWTSDNGDNTSGVEVFGSGYIDESGEYRDYKEATGFWTTTENGDMLEVVTMRNELDSLFITE